MTTSKNGRASFSSASGALLAIPYSLAPGESRNFDLTSLSSQDIVPYSADEPPYLTSQLRSSEWLQRYGLKSQKLTFDQILQQIGYKRVESFIPSIGKNVGAKYMSSQQHEIQHDNGDRYVLTCRPEKLREFKSHLVRMLNLLRKRLAFITNGSRRVFGIIAEPSVCFVCDCKTTDQRKLNEFQSAMKSLLEEQVTKIKRFNIIWVSNDKEQFQEQPIDVTSTVVDQAIDWIYDRKCARNKISISATCEALLKAFTNPVHSIYLISEGESSDSAREILRDSIVKTRLSSNKAIPIHIVSLFCQNNDTETFLRSISQTTNGSYISYKIQHERSDLKPLSNSINPTGLKFQDDKVHIGTNISMTKPEQPIDLSLMYKEINECHSVIDRIDKILGFVQDDNDKAVQKFDTTKSLDALNKSNKINKTDHPTQKGLVIPSSALFHSDESEMTSADWLKVYGVDAQKLDVVSVLQSVAFRHCDGVVTTLQPPENANDQTPANPRTKLINAKYCDQFAHIAWSDGTIRHVFVTPELHRDYERRLRALLEKIRARLSWLKKGSRDLFGTIIEKNIYILIDTSISMENHLNFVKDKLRLLIQDQLFSKERINIVAFNTTTNPWRDRLTKVNDLHLSSQIEPWIQGLFAEGSTNTLAAIRFALADPNIEAIYLLTDGRPDQNERHILSQVQYRDKIPIHTIAFNCQDHVANQFLMDLSKQTGGRFHSFNYGMESELTSEVPESEDVMQLKEELARGEKDLKRVSDLRDECSGRAWSLNNLQTKYRASRTSESPLVATARRSYSTLDTVSGPKYSSTMPQRIDRKKSSSVNSNRRQKSKSAAQIFEKTSRISLNPGQWLLPETEDYLISNDKHSKQKSIIVNQERQVESIETTTKTPTPYDEVKTYLRRNSLVARGLTIFDVLYPTSITVKQPLHVQVIDRHVLAKVWDDILPLTYGSHASKLRLINHYAVDLETYEADLKALIKNYYQFTSKFIWKCLSDEDKKQLGPHLYWVSLPDEDRYKLAEEIPGQEHTNQTALENYAWLKLSKDEQNNLLQKPGIYHERTQIVLKNALSNGEAESALQGVARMDVEIKRAVKFLQISTDLRQYQKRTVNESKQKVESKPVVRRRSSVGRNMNQRVLCRYDADGYFYSGTLQRDHDDRSIVLFDMDIEQVSKGHVLLPTNNAHNQTNLFMDDCVLVHQMIENEEYWAPGTVLCLPTPFSVPPNLYMIRVHDPLPKHVYAHRKDLVRINVELFQRSVLYLQNIDRRSKTDGLKIFEESGTKTPPSSHLSQSELEKILRELLRPLSVKVHDLSKSHRKQYDEIKTTLDDHMGAITILQERKLISQFKIRSTQTYETRPSTTSTTPSPITSTTPDLYPVPLKPGTKVYALWSDDDGLVYRGIVIESNKNDPNSYRIAQEDLHGIESNISRDDIFLESDCCRLQEMDVKSFALVEYPDDSRHCFCPSVILCHNESKTKVRFYDCTEKDLENDQVVIPIDKTQFERYITLRIEKEKSLVNQVTVGLNNQTNTFMLGTIKKRLESGHRYLIQWFDKSESEQTDEHLFGLLIRRDNHREGCYVLAMDDDDTIYKLAKIVSLLNDQELEVEFIELRKNRKNLSPRQAIVPATTTFVISKAYYNTIINRYRKRH